MLRAFERAAAGVLGPGLGRDEGSLRAGPRGRAAIEAPLVIDADGLNAFAGRLERARGAAGADRPHPARRRARPPARARLGARSAPTGSPPPARRPRAAGAVVVLKGDDTIVTDGERVAVNAVSAPGLATAGTGDVLSGLTAALLARGLEPFAAACAAVLAHARAGREAARRVGAAESVIATDVIAAIPVGLRRRRRAVE